MDYSYWDYGTGKVSGSDIFDINSTGNDKIDVLKDPKYYEKYKNLKGYITKMTPKEYFQKCAEIFNTSFDHQVNRIGVEKDYIQHLKSVITLKKDKFPMTYLDFANETQEGRHRMFVAGELFGWDTKFPVLIVDYADKQRSEEEKQYRELVDKENLIQRALDKTLSYSYADFSDFLEELGLQIDQQLEQRDVEFDVQHDDKDKMLHLMVGDIDIEFDPRQIKFKDIKDSLDDDYLADLIDYEDLDDDQLGTILTHGI